MRVGQRTPEQEPSVETRGATRFPVEPAFAPALELMHLQFDVLRVDLPVDGLHHSRKVWNHVDELRYEAQLAALLARNGIRIGAASADAWPALRTIFESGRARVQEAHRVVQTPAPLTLELSPMVEPETIFTFDRAGHLAGRTYPTGKRLVQIDYLVHPERDGSTDLNVRLEIREPLGPGDWRIGDGLLQEAPTHRSYVFSSLEVLLTLRPGEFLVIGPSAAAGRTEYLVGGRFFTGERDGERYETLFCVSPRPFKTQAGEVGS